MWRHLLNHIKIFEEMTKSSAVRHSVGLQCIMGRLVLTYCVEAAADPKLLNRGAEG